MARCHHVTGPRVKGAGSHWDQLVPSKPCNAFSSWFNVSLVLFMRIQQKQTLWQGISRDRAAKKWKKSLERADTG